MHTFFRFFIYIFAVIGFFFVLVFIGMRLGLTNATSKIDSQQLAFISSSGNAPLYETSTWVTSPEWTVFEGAVRKDIPLIKSAAEEANVSSRVIMAILAVEQLRLFHSERAVFEEIFSPLKILGVQSQFSWGVMGIKRETAIEIEKRDTSGLLTFTSENTEDERFLRLTDQHDRSWSYLYAAVYLREFMDEWEKRGYPISDKPGVLATLFNLGFDKSVPKNDPKLGGAIIDIGGTSYTFGALAHDIYYSDVLLEEFPR